MIRKLAFICVMATVAALLAADIVTDLIGESLFPNYIGLALDLIGGGLAYLWLQARKTS